VFGVALALLFLAPAAGANDLGLSVGPIEQENGAVVVSYRVENPWTPRLTETLRGGMPATVTFEVGVWKRRAFWFDKLVLAIQSEHRIFYDPWQHTFRVRSGAVRGKSRILPTLDSLGAYLFAERRVALAAVETLEPEASYYVSVRATIRPLSAEDLDEVEDWLSGEVKSPDTPEHGVRSYLRGLAVNISGLGDRTALAKSEPFRPAFLEAPR
jgi:5-carboxymethyl-2-hydroxymuconate isomerase